MKLALDAASESLVRTAPNPRVGCVIFSTQNRLIGRGVTAPPGGPHAEVSAIQQARGAGEALNGASVYVTLEPCAHTGRTGPCADALIEAGVSEVYVGALDPNPLVKGMGIERLRSAGVKVVTDLLGQECHRLHAPFFKWIKTGRPWVSLKGAMTLDGCLATANGDSKWITGEIARTHVHRLRAQVGGVMVGGETARRDRPALTVRHCEGSDPIAIAVSRMLSIPNDAPLIREGSLLFHSSEAPVERRAQLRSRGVELIEVPQDASHRGLDLSTILDRLGDRGMTHLCVEGGGRLHGAFLSDELVDDLHLYIAPTIIGRGKPLFNLPSMEAIHEGYRLSNITSERLGEDLYLYGVFTGRA